MSIENVLFRCGGEGGGAKADAYIYITTAPNSSIVAIGRNTGKRVKGTSNVSGEAVLLVPALDTYNITITDAYGHVSNTISATVSTLGEVLEVHACAIITVNTDGGATVTATGTNTGEVYTATATYIQQYEGVAKIYILNPDEYTFISHISQGDSLPTIVNIATFTDQTITVQYLNTSWATASNDDIIRMLTLWRNGQIDIQDYWHVGDVRPIYIPQISSRQYGLYTVGPVSAHSNKLKIAKFGDTKNIVTGSDKSIICVFNSPTPYEIVENAYDSLANGFYSNEVAVAVQSALGTLASYLRVFTKYFTTYSSAPYIRGSKTNIRCSGLSDLDIRSSGHSSFSSYYDPLPVFGNNVAYAGYNVALMDYGMYWQGTDTSGVPQTGKYGYQTSIASGYNGNKVYFAACVVF